MYVSEASEFKILCALFMFTMSHECTLKNKIFRHNDLGLLCNSVNVLRKEKIFLSKTHPVPLAGRALIHERKRCLCFPYPGMTFPLFASVIHDDGTGQIAVMLVSSLIQNSAPDRTQRFRRFVAICISEASGAQTIQHSQCRSLSCKNSPKYSL